MFTFIVLIIIKLCFVSNHVFKTITSYEYQIINTTEDYFYYPEKNILIELSIFYEGESCFYQFELEQYLSESRIYYDYYNDRYIGYESKLSSGYYSNLYFYKQGDYFVFRNKEENNCMFDYKVYISLRPYSNNKIYEPGQFYLIDFKKGYYNLKIYHNGKYPNDCITFYSNIIGLNITTTYYHEYCLSEKTPCSFRRSELNLRNTILKNQIEGKLYFYIWQEYSSEYLRINSLIKIFFIDHYDETYYVKNYKSDNKDLEEQAVYFHSIGEIKLNEPVIDAYPTALYNYKSGLNEEYYIYFFNPISEYSYLDLRINNTNTYEKKGITGIIEASEIPPTKNLTYPTYFNFSSNYYYTYIVRITFENLDTIDKNLFLKFADSAECAIGKVFENNKLNNFQKCQNISINSSLSNKNLTVIFFNDSVSIHTIKDIPFYKLNQYELFYFNFENKHKEISFQYELTNLSKKIKQIYITFRNPKPLYSYLIQEGEISFDPNINEYIYNISGNISESIVYSTETSPKKISIVITCLDDTKCDYSDYISIRESNIIIEGSEPIIFDQFKSLSYVVFKFNLDNGKNYTIETNTEKGGYIQTLKTNLNSNDKINECQDNYCKFNQLSNSNYYLIIINKDFDNKDISKKIELLLSDESNSQYIQDNFTMKYFIKDFSYVLELKSEDFQKFKENEELGIVLKTKINFYDKYSISITSNHSIELYEDTKNIINEYEYHYYYLEVSNINSLSFTIKGSVNYDDPLELGFAYIKPPIKIITEEQHHYNSIEGIPLFFKITKTKDNENYMFAFSELALYSLNGKMMSGGKLKMKKLEKNYYFLSNFSSEEILFKFNNSNPLISYFPIKNNSVIHYFNKRPLRQELKYKIYGGETHYFIGLYNESQEDILLMINCNDTIKKVYGLNHTKSLFDYHNISDEKSFVFLNNSFIDVYEIYSKGKTNIILNFSTPYQRNYVLITILIIFISILIIGPPIGIMLVINIKKSKSQELLD